MTDLNNKYIKHWQLETIKQKINELYDLLDEYMKGATEEEKQAIPLYKDFKGNKGLASLLRDFNLVYSDWIDRESLQNYYNVKPKNIDAVINKLDDELNLFSDDAVDSIVYDIINEVEEENK